MTGRFATDAYDRLVEKGCKCGTDQSANCEIHGSSNNRGLAAFYKAGMPRHFPSPMTCVVCHTEGLCYPNIEIDDPKGSGRYRPTLICPNCSGPVAEWRLRREAEDFGYELNDNLVFAGVSTCSPGVAEMQAKIDSAGEHRSEVIEGLTECWEAQEDGTDSTAEFERGDDGRLIFYDDGPRPSYALALLFDWERHLRGESTVMTWEAAA